MLRLDGQQEQSWRHAAHGKGEYITNKIGVNAAAESSMETEEASEAREAAGHGPCCIKLLQMGREASIWTTL